jgi:GalNAc-alpha-(1->4)-GalNAc-alpha-(1->3)-diNAcBac-PP-undecaprenol alpha-1,4-N-acetyl-D-galactosaminyltransferase
VTSQRRLRVLLVIGSLQAGGAERVLAAVANGLADRGVDATVLTLSHPSTDFYELSDGVLRRFPTASMGRLSKLIKFQCELQSATRQADVVVSFLTETNVASSAWSLLYARPAIVSERIHPEFNSNGWRRWLMAIAMHVYRRPSIHLVVQSAGIARIFAAAGVPSQVVPNGVKVPSHIPDWDSRPRFAVVVGSLSTRKRVADVLKAWSETRLDEDGWILRIVGDGPLRNDLESLSADLGIAKSVEFLGQCADVTSILRAARIYVSASAFEGTSNSLLEAMAQGCACIVSDCPGDSRELVQMERGVTFPVGDRSALARELSRIGSDGAASERLGAAAYKAVKQRDWETAQGMWCDLIEAINPKN